MQVIKHSGKETALDLLQVGKQVEPAIVGLKNINKDLLLESMRMSISDRMTTNDIQLLLIKSSLDMIDEGCPDATYLAARFKIYDLYHSIKRKYLPKKVSGDVYKLVNLQMLIDFGRKHDLYTEWIDKYTEEEVAELNNIIVSSDDNLYDWQGALTLTERYLGRDKKGEIFELPQHMHMAVAMFAAQDEKDKIHWAKKFYKVESLLEFINSTPINKAGRLKNGSTISCLIGAMPDTTDGIYDSLKAMAIGSKHGAGWGYDISGIRSLGSSVGDVIEAAGGKVPVCKLINDTALGFDQLGNRPGAIAPYIAVWDIDIFDFIDVKKKNGDDRKRAHDIFPSINYDDVFMDRLDKGLDYTLFDPKDVRILLEVHGDEFKVAYEGFEEAFKKNPENFNPNTRTLPTVDVFRHIGLSFFSEGVPFTHFIDNSNKNHLVPQLGKIRSSNLCVGYDTPILTKRYGNAKIGELVESGVSSTECWNGYEWSETPLFKTSEEDDLTRVTFNTGFYIDATRYHKWYIYDRNDKELEVTTETLRKGDDIYGFELPISHTLPTVDKSVFTREEDLERLSKLDATPFFKLQALGNIIDTSGVKTVTLDDSVFIIVQKKFKQDLFNIIISMGILPNTENYNNDDVVGIEISSYIGINDSLNKPFRKSMTEVRVVSIDRDFKKASTYCGTEPVHHKLVFNGVLTGNCSEIFQATSETETAVCNLGSLNLARVNTVEDLKRVTAIGIRLLDNLVDLTVYPDEATKQVQLKRRSLGLGALGEAEYIANQQVMYGSEEHEAMIEVIYRTISETAFKTSQELGLEKGCVLDLDRRNAYLMALAPNTTSGALAGTTNSFDCVHNRSWTEDNQLGKHTMVAPNLNVDNYPFYINSFTVGPIRAAELVAVRQKHIDQGISFSIFLNPKGLKLSTVKDVFIRCWKLGLNSVYYWRSKPPKKGETKMTNIACVGCEN